MNKYTILWTAEKTVETEATSVAEAEEWADKVFSLCSDCGVDDRWESLDTKIIETKQETSND